MQLKDFLHCITRGAVNTINHDGIEHAGYLAFLGLLALFPFLVFVVALIGAVGQDTLAAQYVAELFRKLPKEVTQAIAPRIDEITSGPPQGLLTLAIVGAIWTASSAVEGLRTTLNRAYHVSTPPAYLFRRTLSMLQLLAIAFILTVALLFLIALPVALSKLEEAVGMPLFAQSRIFAQTLLFVLTPALLFGVVCLLYYTLPNIKQRFVSVAPGAAMVVGLWMLTAKIFTYYLTHFNQVSLIYGSLGGIISSLVFFYLSNLILIFGAEFNHLLSLKIGVKIVEREETGLPPPDPDGA